MPANRRIHFQSRRSFVFSRRTILKSAFAQGVIGSLPVLHEDLARAQSAIDQPLNRFPRMMQTYLVEQARRSTERRRANLSGLQNEQEAKAYVQEVRRKIRESFGPFPDRTPLNARVTGRVQRDGYHIENIVFESRPNFPVTANLYVPEGAENAPAVVGTCGHSNNGKAAEPYQAFSQGLAKQGFVCLIYDPIGQGERIQYLDEDLTSSVGVGVQEHLLAGNQQFLLGEFFGTWRAWDGVRAVDYLETRREVDPNRIGVTGNSGGGTMTTWLCGLENRFAMAAPSCFVSTFLRNLENELPQDTEQCPPRALALGLDHGDFLAAMAPKPVIILAKERDYFDVRGAEETYAQLKRLYGLLGAEENVALFVGPTGHGYSEENRTAMYAWFRHAAKMASPKELPSSNTPAIGEYRGPNTLSFHPEPDLKIEDDETLWCTTMGQVGTDARARTIIDLTNERAETLAASRKSLSVSELQSEIVEVLKLPRQTKTPPDYRIWRHLGARGYPAKSAIAYTIETEPGAFAVAYRLTHERWHSRPARSSDRAILYISHLSADDELRNEPLVKDVIEDSPGIPFYACDVRGIGESQPGTCQPDSFHRPYGSDYFYAIHNLMLDRSYIGQRTFDVLRVVQWLQAQGHDRIHLLAQGWGTLPATFAAVLAESVRRVTFKNALRSYQSIAAATEYDWPLSSLTPGILARFDLPDCYAELEKRKHLRMIDPWGPEGQSSPWFEKTTAWHDVQRHHFRIAGRDAYLVVPKKPAPDLPWVWRARFPGYHDEIDRELVAQGFHIGYVDVSDLFGGPDAISIGDEFYRYVTRYRGLSSKVCLEGVSRGGLFVYNWAVENVSQVECIYCDTPVCDIKSWPGGQFDGIGSKDAWQKCLRAYRFTESQATAHRGNPVDHARRLAQAKVPILHIVSEDDRVVPPAENTYRLKAELERHGHSMRVISVKQGTKASNGHHFDHPAVGQVVGFIRSNTKR